MYETAQVQGSTHSLWKEYGMLILMLLAKGMEYFWLVN